MAIDIDMDIDLDGGVPVQPPTRTRTPPPIDSDTDTPPRNPPHKRVHHSHHHALGVSYKECMKNHAASIGGHALDGCCEFMPGPTFNPTDPTSLKCGACGCHRNFHRRDPDDPTPLNHHPTPARRVHSPPTASQLLLSLSQSPSGPSDEVDPRPVNLTGGVLVGYAENKGQNGNFTSSTVISSGNTSSSSKKRFRTKFSQEQKDKMYEFSERIGWKLKKGEEKLIEEFVNHIGVERSVFKVWMHNNKHTSSSSAPKCKLVPEQIHKNNNVKAQEEDKEEDRRAFVTTASSFAVAQQQQQQQQHNSSVSNGGGKSSNNNNNNGGNVGNCGTRLFDNHNHGHNRQFNFGNGGGQEATQAQ